MDEILGLLAMFPQARLGDDDRLACLGRIKAVLFQTSPPRLDNNVITSCICAMPDVFDFSDVISKLHRDCSGSSQKPPSLSIHVYRLAQMMHHGDGRIRSVD